jgi:hypothetical protein
VDDFVIIDFGISKVCRYEVESRRPGEGRLAHMFLSTTFSSFSSIKPGFGFGIGR